MEWHWVCFWYFTESWTILCDTIYCVVFFVELGHKIKFLCMKLSFNFWWNRDGFLMIFLCVWKKVWRFWKRYAVFFFSGMKFLKLHRNCINTAWELRKEFMDISWWFYQKDINKHGKCKRRHKESTRNAKENHEES